MNNDILEHDETSSDESSDAYRSQSEFEYGDFESNEFYDNGEEEKDIKKNAMRCITATNGVLDKFWPKMQRSRK